MFDVFFFHQPAIMVNELTESALFLLNLAYDYKDLQCKKATAGVSVAFVKQKLQKQQQNKATTSVRRRRLSTEDPDDDPEAEGTSSAASKPTKKRLVDSDVVVVARDPPSKRSRKASTSEKVRNEEPIDFQYSCHYGGLEDEDDYWQEEREAIGRCPDKEPGARILSDRVRCCRYVAFENPMLIDPIYINAGSHESSVVGENQEMR